MHYEGECIENIQSVESYKNCIKLLCNKITMLKFIKNMNDCFFIL